MNHVVALSGGKDSTAMALRLRELNPGTEYLYVITPTGDELPEMWAHWKLISELLEKPLTTIYHPLGLNGLIEKQRALPNHRMRWCTRLIKIEPYARWLEAHLPAVSYVGIRADEEDREAGDYSDIPGVEMNFPMREWGWELSDVTSYLRQRGISIPKRTDCARCFFQRIGEWRDLWRDYPAIFMDAAEQERRIGASFRSPSRDTWPAYLDEMAVEFEQGRPIRGDGTDPLKCRVCTK